MQQILTDTQISQKINRLGHQLLEDCFEQSEIFIGGIVGNGVELANRLAEIIQANSDVKVHLFEIQINKSEPWSEPITLSMDRRSLKNGYIVLVDDVLNSGKTMQYALTKILDFPTRAIKTVALVDRKHRRFPIKADFVGLSLSTTLKDRVEVQFTKSEQKAYLI
ncbi:MAG: hypothetical protein A3D92_14555 [Bacteroidetes bacterium RIFCSPHIGHO2_02_FULL_44_7]|nr:MAG: hypothetical protein A3D92_14555 [Bacteroidetes bacterium RIFCSPHIGHO2_02_FULL_44_7]